MSIGFYKKKEEDLLLFFHCLFDVPNLRGNHVSNENRHKTADDVTPEHLDAVRTVRKEGSKRTDDVSEHSAEEVAAEADRSDTEHFVYLLCSFDVFIIAQGQAKVNTYFSNNECNYYLLPRSRVYPSFQKYHGQHKSTLSHSPQYRDQCNTKG